MWQNKEKIAIISHLNPDFDAVASMFVISKLYHNCDMIINGSPDHNVRRFFDNYWYFFKFKKERNVNITDYKKVIIVDTHSIERLGNFSDLIIKGILKVEAIYDHHALSTNLENISKNINIFTYGSTVTGIFCQEKERLSKIKFDEIELSLMLAGIYEDTGYFSYNNTHAEDLWAASNILSLGGNLKIVKEYTKKYLSNEQLELLDTLKDNKEEFEIDGIRVAISTASSKIYIGDLAIITQYIKQFENLDVFFSTVKMGRNIYITGRSRVLEFDIGKMLEHFEGGGGHPSAGSASIKNSTLKEVKNKLLDLIRANIKNEDTAKDIMISPVETLPFDCTMLEAHRKILQHRFSSMPVTKNGHLVGFAESTDLEKALHNKELANLKVDQVTSTDFISVLPTTNLHYINKLMTEKKQKKVLVVNEDNELLGIIAYSDILEFFSKKFPISVVATNKLKTADYSELLINKIDKETLNTLVEIGKFADLLGINCFLIGGFVRDLFLQRTNYDIDLVVESNGIKFAQILSEKMSCNIKVNENFQTATVYNESFNIDIATARVEHYEKPGALPIVAQSTLRYDLFRRDFTINAMAIKINPADFGTLYDFFGGEEDLKNEQVSILHNLSFIEDPTRIFRAIRFEQRLNFHMTDQTLKLLKSAVEYDALSKIAQARIRNELKLILEEENPFHTIKRMAELGILSKLNDYFDDKQLIDEHLYLKISEIYYWYHSLYPKIEIKRWILFLLAFLLPYSEKTADAFLRNYAFDKDCKKILLIQKKVHDQIQYILSQKETQKGRVYFELQKIPIDILLFEMAFQKTPLVEKNIKMFILELKDYKFNISKELFAIYKIKGPNYSKLLMKIQEAILDERIKNERNDIEEYFLSIVKQFLS